MSDDNFVHVFKLFDPSKYVQAFELEGQDRTVTIKRVAGEEIEGENARKSNKPVVYFTDWAKPLILNKTNAKTLIKMYGYDYRKWAGERFTMYPTETKMAGEKVDAVRIRPTKPRPAPPRATGKAAQSLTERTDGLLAAFKKARSVEEALSVWNVASRLRADLQQNDPELMAKVTLAYEGRCNELEAIDDEQPV